MIIGRTTSADDALRDHGGVRPCVRASAFTISDAARFVSSAGEVYVLLRHVAQETSSTSFGNFTSKYDLVQLIEGDRCDFPEPVPGTPEGGSGGGDDVPCPECMSMASAPSGADTNFDGLIDGRDFDKYFDAYADGSSRLSESCLLGSSAFVVVWLQPPRRSSS